MPTDTAQFAAARGRRLDSFKGAIRADVDRLLERIAGQHDDGTRAMWARGVEQGAGLEAGDLAAIAGELAAAMARQAPGVEALNEAAQPVYDAGKAAGVREASRETTERLTHESAAGLFDLARELVGLALDLDAASTDKSGAKHCAALAAAALGRTPHHEAGIVLGVLGRRGQARDADVDTWRQAHELLTAVCQRHPYRAL